MADNKQIDLNTNDIDLIVKCLRREIGAVSNRRNHSQHNEAKADLDLIQSLLGKFNNQGPVLAELAS